MSAHLLHVVGARPNFMKAAPVHRAASALGLRQTLVHTGQHYDPAMSQIFFDQLGLPAPDVSLGVGSGSHAAQTAAVLSKIEPVIIERAPDWVVVYGDVNSTVAAALAAVKLGVRTAHVEAGLRSRDRAMPEEHNRIVTDHLCDALLTPSPDADANLANEGIPTGRVRRVGNVMVDTLLRLLPIARANEQARRLAGNGPFVLVTLHRPSNVDDPERLGAILRALGEVSSQTPVIFPVHPRTRARLDGGIPRGISLIEPLGYLEFLSLQDSSAAVVTDSGGIQEETTVLGIPCLTLRDNTERPITLTVGTNELVTPLTLADRCRAVLRDGRPGASVPELWDGRAGERIAAFFREG